MRALFSSALYILTASLISNPFSSFAANLNMPELYQAQDWVADKVFTQGVEGPAVDKAGSLYAVNFAKEGTIGKVNQAGQASLFLTLPSGSTGNGIRFDQAGNMYIADYTGHNVLRWSAKTQQLSVFNHTPEMNQPNDLAITRNGVLFASDPNWSEGSGNLWRISEKGQSQLIEADMGTTNGVEVSPDQTRLYVNESVQRKVWVYDLDANAVPTNKRLLIEFKDFGLDGMRADKQGNLYIARYGKGVIAKVSPTGELLREIPLKGQHPTNVAFGGQDGRTLYVTMQKRGAIEKLQVAVPGAVF